MQSSGALTPPIIRTPVAQTEAGNWVTTWAPSLPECHRVHVHPPAPVPLCPSARDKFKKHTERGVLTGSNFIFLPLLPQINCVRKPFLPPQTSLSGRVHDSPVTSTCKNESLSQESKSPIKSVIKLHCHSPTEAPPSPICRPHPPSLFQGGDGVEGTRGGAELVLLSVGLSWPELAITPPL